MSDPGCSFFFVLVASPRSLFCYRLLHNNHKVALVWCNQEFVLLARDPQKIQLVIGSLLLVSTLSKQISGLYRELSKFLPVVYGYFVGVERGLNNLVRRVCIWSVLYDNNALYVVSTPDPRHLLIDLLNLRNQTLGTYHFQLN